MCYILTEQVPCLVFVYLHSLNFHYILSYPCSTLCYDNYAMNFICCTLHIAQYLYNAIQSRYDRALILHDIDKPKHSFEKIVDAHGAGLCCMAYDPQLNWLITGGFDGAFKVRWHTLAKFSRLSGIQFSFTSICLPCICIALLKWFSSHLQRFRQLTSLNILQYLVKWPTFSWPKLFVAIVVTG